MATIDSLNKSISEMTPEESFNFIRSLRKRRRLASEASSRKRNKIPKTKSLNVANLMATLSATEKEKLIQLLEDS